MFLLVSARELETVGVPREALPRCSLPLARLNKQQDIITRKSHAGSQGGGLGDQGEVMGS